MREPRARRSPFSFLRTIFNTPTMVAIGIDPVKGVFHACVKGSDFERKWTEPITPQVRAVFSLIKGLLT